MGGYFYSLFLLLLLFACFVFGYKRQALSEGSLISNCPLFISAFLIFGMFVIRAFTAILHICMLDFVVLGEVDPQKPHTGIKDIFTELGFSPSCVAQSLSSCERNLVYKEITDQIKNVVNEVKRISDSARKPRNCAEIQKMGDNVSGIRVVYPVKFRESGGIPVFCDQVTDGGGWTVIQHREDLPIRENFYREWIEYKLGFGNLTGEFWLGLNNIHALVSELLMELRVDLEDYEGKKVYAKYDFFYISDETDNYRLRIGNYSGTVGDGLKGTHNDQQFSTIDRDNDKYEDHCALRFMGGWWYNSCHSSNLNGYQYEGKHDSYANGINWISGRSHQMSLTHFLPNNL